MKEKKDLRKEMLAKRAVLGKDAIASASERILGNLFADLDFLKCGSAGFYYPHMGEIDTHKMIERSLAFKKTAYLPKIIDGGIVFCEFGGYDQLMKGKYEIMEPAGNQEGTPEVLVVPGVAFDIERHRLGFGKGYYDRYLSSHECISIGVCYAWQVIDKLPKEGHDVRMDKLIAESWVIE